MAESTETEVEEVIIQLLLITLTTVAIFHLASDAATSAKRIVVGATRGNLRTDAMAAYEYELSIQAKGLNGDEATWDSWRAAIELAMDTGPGVSPPAAYTAALAKFSSYFGPPPPPDQAGARDNSEDVRTGTLTFRVLAK